MAGVAILAIGCFWYWTANDDVVSEYGINSSTQHTQSAVENAPRTDDDTKKRLTTSQLPESASSGTSIERKLRQMEINATTNTGLTESELSEFDAALFDAYFDAEKSGNIQAEMYEQLVNELGRDEADFRFAVMNEAGNWEEIKRLISQREAANGSSHSYDQMLLALGINSGEISAAEVEMIMSRGTALPDEAVFNLASRGNVETIKGLADRGLLSNPNYEHPTLSMNAVGAFIEHASNFPQDFDGARAKEALAMLIDIGIETQPAHQSLDPLDLALSYTRNRNVDVKYAMVEVLLENGVRVETSHLQLLQAIRDKSAKARLEQLMANYL